MRLRVAISAAGGAAETPVLARLLDQPGVSAKGVQVETVPANQAHDLRLHVEDGRVWLASPDGRLHKVDGPDKTHSIALNQADAGGKLHESLQAIGKAVNLMRIGAQLGTNTATRNLEVAMKLTRKGRKGEALAATSVAAVSDGDSVDLMLRNRGRAAVDVTALYLDSNYGISVVYPRQAGDNNRLDSNASETLRVQFDETTVGIERLIIIAVESRAGRERHDFSFLAQRKLERTRGSAPLGDVGAIFEMAGFGSGGLATRGEPTAPAPANTEMLVTSFKVVGRKDKLPR